MTANVILVAAYAAVLLGVAWLIDHAGSRSAKRSAAWRTGNFVYHEDRDAWRCHEDQWLWPASFDPDKRVIRYQGQHAICGRCPAKTECSPTPGPREITKELDPWPHSEAGRFHRGLALAVAAVGLVLPLGMLFGARTVADVAALTATVLVMVLLGILPLSRHLLASPTNFPEHIPSEASSDAVDVPRRAEAPDLEQVVDRYATRWGTGRRRVPSSTNPDQPAGEPR